jgi:hypothetical protein
VDEWNEVPEDSGGGDDAIEQHDTDGTVGKRASKQEATATAAATDAVGEPDIHVPISGTVVTLQKPNTP